MPFGVIECFWFSAGQDGEDEVNELIIQDPEATEVDLNHGRIQKLENLECLTQVCTFHLYLPLGDSFGFVFF